MIIAIDKKTSMITPIAGKGSISIEFTATAKMPAERGSIIVLHPSGILWTSERLDRISLYFIINNSSIASGNWLLPFI
jgi:hypothetical protein